MATKYFEYETSGSFEDKVQLLQDFLGKECSDAPVILLAHSMGGPLCMDAYSQSPWVRGIIAYDSPFFGVHPNAASDALRHANERAAPIINTLTSFGGGSSSATVAGVGALGMAALGLAAYGAYSSNQALRGVVDSHVKKAQGTACIYPPPLF